MRSFVTLMLVLFGGCGRFSFSEAPDGGGGGDSVDAPLPESPKPTHHYKLAGSFADEAGGPPLVAVGGTLDAGLGYKFDKNQGLKLQGAMPADAYTVDMRFTFHDIGACNDGGDRFCKLLDFKGLDKDEGLYAFEGKLHFVISVAVSPPLFVESERPVLSADREAAVTLTRAADNSTVAYVNGERVFGFEDKEAMASFNYQGQVAYFAVDDRPTGQREASSGSFREIKIWDKVLTPAEIDALH